MASVQFNTPPPKRIPSVPKPVAPVRKALSHMSYECPGLTGPGSRLNVMPLSFDKLLSTFPVVIPLFQRTYCWTDDQINGWWRDACKTGAGVVGGSMATGSHGTGKCIFKKVRSPDDPSKPVLLCIDGQQRCTTLSILLSTYSDALLSGMRQIQDIAASRDLLSMGVKSLNHLQSFLWQDPGTLSRFAKDWACSNKVSGGDRAAHAWADLFEAGKVPSFLTPKLTPSFVDRAPFFMVLTVGTFAHSLHTIVKESQGKDRADEVLAEFNESAWEFILASRSKQARARTLFGGKLGPYIASKASQQDPQNAMTVEEQSFVALCREAERVTGRFALMYVEVLSEINLAQVFLWFQEKSLFSLGALLWNPSPGIKFRACDLVRNLILSTSMSLGLDQQEALYRECWLEPFELFLVTHTLTKQQQQQEGSGGGAVIESTVVLDACIHAFLCEQESVDPAELLAGFDEEVEEERSTGSGGVAREARRHTSALEKQIQQIIASNAFPVMAAARDSGMMLYARFVTFIEAREIARASQSTSEQEEQVAVEISEETCQAVLKEMHAFAQRFVDGQVVAQSPAADRRHI